MKQSLKHTLPGMNQAQDLKAGPSIASIRPRRASSWQRSIQAICIFLALLLGYSTFTEISKGGQGLIWKWTYGGEKNGQEQSSKGSQYLLGVGKADITGYFA